jgi:hypothetical protein
MNALLFVQIVSVLISLIAPIFFFSVIEKGIRNARIDVNLKLKYNWILFAGISIWVFLIFLLTVNQIFAYQTGDVFPKFLIGLFIPVLIFVSLLGNRNFRMILDHISFEYLAASQIWRVLGSIFFVVALSGLGPIEFISSGFGDLLTGIIAILTVRAFSKGSKWSNSLMWSLLILGVVDLLVVLYILLSHYPIWSTASPSTALAGSFPMMLIIGIAAPFALLLHVSALRKLVLGYKANKLIRSAVS